jgi:septal ring factor EnvC (AmiA/AmiB activator)
MTLKFKYFLFFLALVAGANASAQKSKREVLEARRIQLQKDKVYINALLSNTIRKEENVLVQLNEINGKIKNSEELINVIQKESNALSDEIYTNQLEINQNKRDLEVLKKDYAEMIYKSYKSKSQNSRIMFLLSSENFFQAYKRFQYMKQYTTFRKLQADEILRKTEELQVLTDSLKIKKEWKQDLLNQAKKEQEVIENEKKQQQNLLNEVKRKEKKYQKQIKDFLAEEARIDAQIDQLIREAIAASNNNSGTTTSGATFALTAEAKELASQFTSNKGKLPWPVDKGFVSTYYGKQPHPIVKTATIQSNGVRITTEEGTKARAVFNGTVLAVQVLPGNKKAVLIQHGNYITVYKNLENVTVNKGDKVTTKEEIGTIFTDKVTGKTILGFVLLQNTTTENPATWIYQM